jgi:hypothetical protein
MQSKKRRYQLDQSPFFKLRSKKRLAELLHISQPKLRRLCRHKSEFYNVFYSKKLERVIEKPTYILKTVQKRINKLLSRIEVLDCVYSPSKGESTISNAIAHKDGKNLYKVDVKKYFQSVKKRKVYWFFHKIMSCSEDVSGILAELLTYDEHLPTGAPTSPIMSYFANLDMWKDINSLASASGHVVTAWIDDVSISGESVPRYLVWQIKQRVHKNGLAYHKEKFYSKSRPKKITGIIIRKNNFAVPLGKHKKLKNLEDSLEGIIDPQKREKLEAQILGLKLYIAQVENA